MQVLSCLSQQSSDQRSTFDFNVGADKVAVRVAGVYEKGATERFNLSNQADFQGLYAQLAYKINRKITVRVEGERNHKWRQLWTVDVGSGELRPGTSGAAQIWEFSWAPDGGFVAIVNHKAVDGLFKTEREARDLIEDLSPQGPSSLAETFAA